MIVPAVVPLRWPPGWKMCARCSQPVSQDDAVVVDQYDGGRWVEVVVHDEREDCKDALA